MNSEDFERVADGLSEVTLAMRDVDLNPMLPDDVRTLLDAQEELSEMCKEYRQNQHAAKRHEEESED